MIDLEIFLEDPASLDSMLQARQVNDKIDISLLQDLIRKNKKLIGQIQQSQSIRNQKSKEIGILLSQGEKERADPHKEKVKNIGNEILRLEKEKQKIEMKIHSIAAELPNWIDPDVPSGGEEANILVRSWGTKPQFDFEPKTHDEIGEKTGILDMERGVKLAGSRFYIYKNTLALLERSLLNFMLDLHTQRFGYTELTVPLLIEDEGMYTSGQFPKFRGEYYSLDRDGLSLIPTAEVPLINLYRDEVLKEDDLPILLTAASSCFRREAGAAGKDTRGLIRVHQFQKVELVQLVHPNESAQKHEEMTRHAEEVLQILNLPYRVILKAAGDTGATASKSYDLEVWLPGMKRWLEISSISNCRDYQARRGKIRFRQSGNKGKNILVHTLNASGVAAGRCAVALIENLQRHDMSFDIPPVLKKYMTGHL